MDRDADKTERRSLISGDEVRTVRDGRPVRTAGVLVEVYGIGNGRVLTRVRNLGPEVLNQRELENLFTQQAEKARERVGVGGRTPVLASRVPVEVLLAAVDYSLRNGGRMTGANLAFELLCDALGVDRDALVFDPGWVSDLPS